MGYFIQRGIADSRNWVVHTYDVRENLQELETGLVELRGAALGYQLSGDASQIRYFEEQAAVIPDAIENVRSLTVDNPRQQARLDQLKPLIANYVERLKISELSAEARASNRAAHAEAIQRINSHKAEIDSIVQAMGNDESRLLETRLTTWRRMFNRNIFIFVLAFALCFVLLGYNFRLLARDVARTREIEQLQQENIRASRTLNARILELQDAERRRVARELHDSVGQFLVSLKLNLEQMEVGAGGAPESTSRLLSDTIDLTDRTISEVRTISHLLHPPLLDEVGFESAARWYTEGFAKRSGLAVTLNVEGLAGNRLPKEVELALFRVLQECLTNAHRHSSAKAIGIKLTRSDGEVRLAISDDGKGLPRQIISRHQSGLGSGVGLAGMRERVRELHGRMELESSGKGTTIRVVLPTEEAAEKLKV